MMDDPTLVPKLVAMLTIATFYWSWRLGAAWMDLELCDNHVFEIGVLPDRFATLHELGVWSRMWWEMIDGGFLDQP